MLKKLLTIAICLLFLSSIANAWLDGYGYRKKITIQGTNLDANVTHFPLLIYIVDADIDDECDDDGDRSFDIRFTQSDDSVLDVNWEDYSEAGGNATIIAWVSDAGWTIESDGSTEIYLYYGNAAAGDPATDEGVWDSDFKAVWHLNEANGARIDATTNDNDLDDNATVTQDDGKIYKCADFTRVNSEFLSIADVDQTGLELNGTDYTWSFWIKYDDITATYHGLCEKGASVGGEDCYRSYVELGGGDGWAISHNDTGWEHEDSSWNTATAGVWYHYSVRYNDTSNDMVFGKDAAFDGADTMTQGIPGNAYPFWLGRYGATYMEGKIDEFRVSNSYRADAWTKFEYHNVFQGDNELTWGAEEEAPADGFVPRVIIIR